MGGAFSRTSASTARAVTVRIFTVRLERTTYRLDTRPRPRGRVVQMRSVREPPDRFVPARRRAAPRRPRVRSSRGARRSSRGADPPGVQGSSPGTPRSRVPCTCLRIDPSRGFPRDSRRRTTGSPPAGDPSSTPFSRLVRNESPRDAPPPASNSAAAPDRVPDALREIDRVAAPPRPDLPRRARRVSRRPRSRARRPSSAESRPSSDPPPPPRDYTSRREDRAR